MKKNTVDLGTENSKIKEKYHSTKDMVKDVKESVKNERDLLKEKPNNLGIHHRPYPRHTLEEALVIATAIQDNNAGKPMKRLFVADAVGRKPTSSEFKYLLSSSQKYGLTVGTEKAETISLTDIGNAITKPLSPEEKTKAMQKASLSPDLFNKVYRHYKDAKLPGEDFLKNVLEREFKVPREHVDECYNMIVNNGNSSSIIRSISGSSHIVFDDYTPTNSIDVEHESLEEQPHLKEEGQGLQDPHPTAPEIKQKPKVFISHSKNKKILEQLKDMLSFGEFDYRIAVEKETVSIPVPDKVFDLMRECNCAIINISADEENKQEDDSYKLNENVLIEIGGAYVHYDKRVILIVDKRLKLPSNLQGLYCFEYEGDELSWLVGMKLQKALTEFKKKI